MANDINDLNANLKQSAAARAKFLAGVLELLEKNGVDVKDEEVLKKLDLNLDLSNGEEFVKGLAASTVVVTVVM